MESLELRLGESLAKDGLRERTYDVVSRVLTGAMVRKKLWEMVPSCPSSVNWVQ